MSTSHALPNKCQSLWVGTIALKPVTGHLAESVNHKGYLHVLIISALAFYSGPEFVCQVIQSEEPMSQT